MGCGPSKKTSTTTVERLGTEQNDSSDSNKATRVDNVTVTDVDEDGVPEPVPSKLSKKNLLKDVDFTLVDEHARKAHDELRKNLPDLVYYLSAPSKDPLHIVRSFFVWIAKNIRYDTDGYFGKSEKSPCDPESVLISGKSVCEGYANVMVEMCKHAEIPVKKISGFSKGYSYSPEHPFTTITKTNHAWNAVYIRGNWFLLDSTWGAGSLQDKEFKPEFKEFYFLTDPEQFAYSHFPYQDGNLEESLKWQLLKNPLSLEKFNRLLNIEPAAFEIGLLPSSHKDCIVRFNDELELALKEEVPKTTKLSMKFYRKEDHILYEEAYYCYAYATDEGIAIKVKPQKGGLYRLKIFGAQMTVEKTENMPMLFQYILNCTVPHGQTDVRRYPYPKAFTQALIDDCQVLEPLGKPLLPNTVVKLRFKSPLLSRMSVQKHPLEKNGDEFEGTITTPESGFAITVYGSRSESGSLDGQYMFCVA